MLERNSSMNSAGQKGFINAGVGGRDGRPVWHHHANEDDEQHNGQLTATRSIVAANKSCTMTMIATKIAGRCLVSRLHDDEPVLMMMESIDS